MIWVTAVLLWSLPSLLGHQYFCSHLPLTGHRPISEPFCRNTRMIVCENPSRSTFSELLGPVHLASTISMSSLSFKSLFYPILMLGFELQSSRLYVPEWLTEYLVVQTIKWICELRKMSCVCICFKNSRILSLICSYSSQPLPFFF